MHDFFPLQEHEIIWQSHDILSMINKQFESLDAASACLLTANMLNYLHLGLNISNFLPHFISVYLPL